MKTILVTGCAGSAGFNFIRSLKMKKGKYFIIGTDINKYHLALSNADIRYLVPLNTQKEKYIRALNTIIEKYHVDLIHPQPDQEVAFLARNKNKINTKMFLPSLETINKCQDKLVATKILENNRIKVPESYLINSKRDLVYAFNTLSHKNDKLWLRAIRGAGSRAALPIKEIGHALFWIDYWNKNKNIGYGDFMLSEFLPGKEFAFQSVWRNGDLIVSQARQRLEYVFGNLTPSGQSSSPAVAITVENKYVNDIATKAIKAVDNRANGIFCVDLKENRNGDVCIIEINLGRFFTTSDFFSEAGINMPDIYINLALNQRILKVKKYNNLEKGIYWLRTIDMGTKLVKNNNWEISNL